MRRSLLVGLFVLSGTLPGAAQLLPNTNQAFQLAPAFNPAFTGIEEFTSIKVGYRSQWTSFSGAPKYLNLVAQTRLSGPFNQKYNALPTGDPLTMEEIPRSKRMIHGIGVTLNYLTTGQGGITETLVGGIAYSLHYPISTKTYLSVGTSLNYQSTKIRVDKLGLEDDPIGGQNSSFMNVRVGFVLYSTKYYVHGAYLQAYSQTHVDDFNVARGYGYNLYGGAGVRLWLSPETELRPSISMLQDVFDNIELNYSMKLFLSNGAWGGLGYNDNGFASLILGFELNSLLGVAYSYETSTSGLKGFNNGSNEIIVALKINNLRKVNPYLW